MGMTCLRHVPESEGCVVVDRVMGHRRAFYLPMLVTTIVNHPSSSYALLSHCVIIVLFLLLLGAYEIFILVVFGYTSICALNGLIPQAWDGPLYISWGHVLSFVLLMKVSSAASLR